ncbi:MAG: recombination regulator RecX [Acetatifactor sp.]|nr:recombination regulator RecX [Acetatifactor sp.]
MEITGIEDFKSGRYKIHIDNEFAFVLYKGELHKYGIKEGNTISEEVYDEIVGEVLVKRAKLRAMNLLTKRDYTTGKLREKLREGLYPPSVIEKAIEYVTGFHYLDDYRYAYTFLSDHCNDKTLMRMKSDLAAKGIKKDVFEKALLDWQDNGGFVDEDAMIQNILRKRGYMAKKGDEKEYRRIYGLLMRNGFSADSINRNLKLNR